MKTITGKLDNYHLILASRIEFYCQNYFMKMFYYSLRLNLYPFSKLGDEIVASRVDMHKAPFIILPLEPDEVERNGRIVMTVRFDGHPLPEIKWYHNNREIQQTNNTLINNYKNESILVIVQCTPNEVGKYEARAMNESGEARSSATLRLKG